MSAVDEYRKECASRGLWPVPEDGSLLCIADAAIAELEVELAAVKTHTCKTCRYFPPYHVLAVGSNCEMGHHPTAFASFHCSDWAEREKP